MRINLKVPYAQKEAAKELGAHWDPVRKVWYVIDPEIPEMFSDWRPEIQDSVPTQSRTTSKESSVNAVSTGTGVTTGPKELQRLCNCSVLPWEHCSHSLALA